MTITMHSVRSSHIDEAGHNHQARTLIVTFKKFGAVNHYREIPE
jgi:hypothetical protein